ncbi:MAG: hypothetical protein N2Z22_05715 [Turneriella sp.]|nr:hypothetical protein [Turneriella sp.]
MDVLMQTQGGTKMQRTILATFVFMLAIFATQCTQNATLLGDAANALNPQAAADAATAGGADPLLAKKLRSIWIVGGSSATGAAANPPAYAVAVGAYATRLDYYDPVDNNWNRVLDTEWTGTYTPVLMACYAGYNGRIFVIGGLQQNNTFTSAAPSNLVQIYNVATNSWSTGTNMPLAVSAAACAKHGQYVYVTGGSSGNANAFTLNNAGNIIMRYDMLGNSWSSIAAGTAPAAPAAATAATESCMVSDGFSLYKFDGKTAAATLGAVASFAAYNVTAGAYGNITFQAPAPLRVGSSCIWLPATADLPARYISIGGLGGANITGNTTAISLFSNTGGSTALNGTYVVYAPYNGPATAGTNLPAARSHGAAALKGKTIYYFGGNSWGGGATANPTPSSTVYAADAELPFWTNKVPFTTTNIPPMPTARWGHGAVTVD